MIKYLLLLLSIPTITMGQKFSPHVELQGGLASTVYQNKFEKTYNANSNGVWKPSLGLNFLWFQNEQSGLLFSFGLSYAQYGLNFDGNYGRQVGNIMIEENAHWNYLQLPIAVGYQYKLGKLGVYGKVGILPSYLISYRFDYQYTDNFGLIAAGAKVDQKTDYLDQKIFRPFQLFGSAGLGVKYPIHSTFSLGIEVQYQYGFLEIENRDAKYKTNNSDFWTPYNSTENLKQRTFSQFAGGQSTLFQYTTKTPHSKLSSLGFSLGLLYSF